MTIDEYVRDTLINGKNYISENIGYMRTWEEALEGLEMSDEVTGNESGTFTRTIAEAEENVSDVIWDEEFHEYLKDLGTDIGEVMERGACVVDVYARFWALEYYCLDELEEYYTELRREMG